jgi:hypothetical protein
MIDTLLAYVFYALIESPFTNIFGVLFRNNSVKESKNLNNEKNSPKLIIRFNSYLNSFYE